MRAQGFNCQALLEAIEPGQCLTTADLAAATGLSTKVVAQTAGGLISLALLERAEIGCYRITKKGSARLASGDRLTSGPNGPLTQEEARRPKRRTQRDLFWRAMRSCGKFTAGDLLRLSNQTERSRDNLQRYLRGLKAHQYVAEIGPRERGTAKTSNGFKRFCLLKNSGPAAPVVKINGDLWDPNSRLLLPAGGGR